MTHLPEIGARNRYRKPIPVSYTSDMQNLVPNVSGTSFWQRTCSVSCRLMVLVGTLKTRDHKKYGGRKRGTEKRGTKFSRVEKAGPLSMERETDKYRRTAYN